MEAVIIGAVIGILLFGWFVAWVLISGRNREISSLKMQLEQSDKECTRELERSNAANVRAIELGRITDNQSRELAELQGVVNARDAEIVATKARQDAFRDASYNAVGQMVISTCRLVTTDPKEARDAMALDALERFRRLNELDEKIDFDLVFFSVDESALRIVLSDLLKHRNAAFTELVLKLSPEISKRLLLHLIPNPAAKTEAVPPA